jgi:cytochrome c heme-lyase
MGSFHHPHRPSSQPLSTEREVSSIPRGPTEGGVSPGDDAKWVYPSEAQFYSALLRKHHATSSSPSSHGNEMDPGLRGVDDGRLGAVEVDKSGAAVTNGNVVKPPKAHDMKVVVPIHNAVNEQTWAKILQWEAGRGGDAYVLLTLVKLSSHVFLYIIVAVE